MSLSALIGEKIREKFIAGFTGADVQGDGLYSASLGADLRALRRARGVTLAELASAAGRSVGWLSQVERDMSTPSIDELTRLAQALSVPLSLFFGRSQAPPEEAGFVVRAGARRQVGNRETGLVEELLSPDLTDDFEVIHSTFAPGAAMHTPRRRPTCELGYLVLGRLTLWIGGRRFDLCEGDSFRIRGEAYAWENPYDEPAVAIWVIAPPVY